MSSSYLDTISADIRASSSGGEACPASKASRADRASCRARSGSTGVSSFTSRRYTSSSVAKASHLASWALPSKKAS